ncbi:hypothetical protein AWB68_06746 [Caballeronia choica]|uniref:Uncharacterized protein n=1 Tax=Caballeronia choica TaxID=326476 RepID=A0A158KPH3_9BURK|nr:hypothetical protein AWB68_06746 [Caballeronia choica]
MRAFHFALISNTLATDSLVESFLVLYRRAHIGALGSGFALYGLLAPTRWICASLIH